jgi:hypothetical protein
MSGSKLGRPFTSNTFTTARSSNATAARPYTVSVGIPTTSPPRKQLGGVRDVGPDRHDGEGHPSAIARSRSRFQPGSGSIDVTP